MENVGSFKFHVIRNKAPTAYQIWIRGDVIPPNGQARDLFYKCGEGWCAIEFVKENWKRHGTSFFFDIQEDAEKFFIRIQQGFTSDEEKALLLKRKLILGGQTDERVVF